MIGSCPPPLRSSLLAASLAVAILAMGASHASAAEYGYEASGNVIADDVLYSVGGGSAVGMGRAGNMRSLGVGVGWNSSLVCGNMSLSTTLQNQLNGATQGFQNIMSSVIQNATSAVASLPALIIQRANPALYNLLTNGILQARVDFDRSKMTCRAMAERMADAAGQQMGWGQIAEGQAMREAILSSDQDAVSSVTEAEESRGRYGVPWVGGQNARGDGQEPIRIVSDIAKAGYNLLNERAVMETSSISEEDCNDGLVCDAWESPEAAAAFAVRVLGEEEQQTCEGCTKTSTIPGVGLTPLIQEEYERKLTALENLVAGNTGTTLENLKEASTASVPVTRRLIEALRQEEDQDLLTRRLASEIALSSVVEKALLLVRILFAGTREPNVASNDLALAAVDKQNRSLQQDLDNLKTELELRRSLSGNAAKTIIDRNLEKRENSRGVFQGDPLPNRLQQIDR